MGHTAVKNPRESKPRPRIAAGTAYTPIPLTGLVADDAVPFPMFLRTAQQTWVLYRPADSELDESHVGRLQAEGVSKLFIRDEDRPLYFQRVEAAVDRVMLDRSMDVSSRANLLIGVASLVTDDLVHAQPDKPTVQRARKVMMASSRLLLGESQGFQAVRQVMSSGPGLARHSLTVGFLSMGLARVVLGADAGTLTAAGLAGLLHDIGEVGHEELEHDPEHATRGANLLRSLGLPTNVVDAARYHHERFDGTGFPEGLQGDAIPEFARIVGLVDIFDRVYSSQEPRVSVFDALRIVAEAYRGCIDERMAAGFVKLFR